MEVKSLASPDETRNFDKGKLELVKIGDGCCSFSYLKNQGPSSLIEVQRVFNVSSDQAQDELQRLESSGEVKRLTLAGDSFWAT